MIPLDKLLLKTRPAKVLSASLPTERHGDHKKAFIDLKLETLLSMAELNDFLANEVERTPLKHIFDLEIESKPIRLPELDQSAPLRADIRGDLTLTVGRKELSFGDAHTVGSVNRISFMNGGQGALAIQFRLDPGPTALPAIKDAIEKGDCQIEFEEYDDSVKAPRNENQAEMGV